MPLSIDLDGKSEFEPGTELQARLRPADRSDKVAIAHVMERVVRQCFLLGVAPVTGKQHQSVQPLE